MNKKTELFNFDGHTATIAGHARLLGINKNTVYGWIHYGLTREAAIAMAFVKKASRQIEFMGETGTLQNHCDRLKVKYKSVYGIKTGTALTAIESLDVLIHRRQIKNSRVSA